MDYDLLIAGGGPAGLTAGIYAVRGGLRTGLVSGIYTGGKASLIDKIENYSGVVETEGFILTNAMREQAEKFGVEFIEGTVKEFFIKDASKKLVLDNGKELTSEYVILAMGTHNKRLGLPNEEKLTGRGVSYCAACDGGFFKNKTIAVVGGGNSALTDALYLSNIAKKVYLIHKRSSFKAVSALTEKAKNNPKIEIILDSVVEALDGEPLSSIKLKNVITLHTQCLDVAGLFVAVGSLPNTSAVAGQIELDNNGYIVTDVNMATGTSNVYAAGDIRVTPLRQIITACADGAVAGDAVIKKKLGR